MKRSLLMPNGRAKLAMHRLTPGRCAPTHEGDICGKYANTVGATLVVARQEDMSLCGGYIHHVRATTRVAPTVLAHPWRPLRTVFFILYLLLFVACNSNKAASSAGDDTTASPVGPAFSADSAYAYCQEQCSFGSRVMNTAAHDRCGEWIAAKFKQYGCGVTLQKADLIGFDGTTLKATNIIASYRPEVKERILLCAHWDSRPWADNDPDENNWHKPIDAANDGASGVAVMIEIARLIQHDTLAVGIDFICFDAEDYGTPRWSDIITDREVWALGSLHWSENPHVDGYTARYGILLDMVGGAGARFYQEGFSTEYAGKVVKKVWQAAKTVGFGSYFPDRRGGTITDDHVPVNQNMGIPTIDIIPYYPDCEESSFGTTWHTLDDNIDNIDPASLQAVGQTLVQVIYSEK